MSQHANVKEENSSVGAANFYPIIIRKNDGFCVYLPEWKISGEGASLEDAYLQFEANKKTIELRAEKFGLATLTPDPYPTLKNKSFYQELTLSFVKSAISVFATVLVIILLLPNIGAAIGYQIKNIVPSELRNPKFWAIQFPSQVNAKLDRLTPEEEEQMRREWNRLLVRTAPMLEPLGGTTDKTKLSRP